MYEFLVNALENDDAIAIEVLAAYFGFRTYGTFFQVGRSSELSVEEQRSILTRLPLVADVHIDLPPIVAPRFSIDVGWPADAVLPSHYLGLGCDGVTGEFSISQLHIHCSMVPSAIANAIEMAVRSKHHRLICQHIRCNRPVTKQGAWCRLCLMGAFCDACMPDDLPCRVCISQSRCINLPFMWLMKRRDRIADGLKSLNLPVDADHRDAFHDIVPHLYAINAAHQLAQRSA